MKKNIKKLSKHSSYFFARPGNIIMPRVLKEKLYNTLALKIRLKFSRHLGFITKKDRRVLITCGNHPINQYKEYEILKQEVFHILKENNNKVYFVDKLSIAGNPKHAQIWGYCNELISLKIN